MKLGCFARIGNSVPDFFEREGWKSSIARQLGHLFQVPRVSLGANFSDPQSPGLKYE